MKLSDLIQKWENEKIFYSQQEIGTGVESFVKSCLESEDLFNLKEGKLSTPEKNRKNVYIQENRAKEGRHADFVIYIDTEIIIPIEVEKYGNIEAGKLQIYNYQKDFDKHYGILTDGNTWRFYNNNVIREICLKSIFENIKIFTSFWLDYIKPNKYYLSFFEPQGQLSLFKVC